MALWRSFWARSWWVKGPVIAVVAFVALVVIAAITAPPPEEDDEEGALASGEPTTPAAAGTAEATPEPTTPAAATADVTPEPTEPPPAPTAEPTEPPPTPGPGGDGFGDGLHRVGTDIEAGTYRSEGGDLCYWERLSGFGGSVGEIIANAIGTGGPEIVTVDASDTGFNSERCGEWIPLAEAGLTLLDRFSDGTYIVGQEVTPGTWSAPGGEGCYWERLAGFGGTLDDIVTNDLPQGSAIVTIAPTDVGFHTNGCGEWSPG